MDKLLVGLFFFLVLLIFSGVFYRQFFKRFWDIVLSGFAIVILSPIFLLLMLIGRMKMKGNPFFVQARPGKRDKNGKEKIFNLIKFRSMTEEKDENGNYLPNDVRLTNYGKILRSTSLDELPELLNIFKGDMSIVGPRPLLVRYLPFYTEEEKHRHDIRPGLTGLAQVNGRNYLSWEEIFNFDLYYVKNVSFFLDLKILFLTVKKVLTHSDIEDLSMETKNKEEKLTHDALDIERGKSSAT